MTALANLAFGLGTLLYLAAALVVVIHAAGGTRRLLDLGSGMVIAGALAYVATQSAHWAAWRMFPLTSLTDGLITFVVFSTLITIPFLYRHGIATLLCFFVPTVSVLALIASGTALFDSAQTPTPSDLMTLPLALHAGCAFLAYSVFLLAAMMGVAYLFQASRLKRQAPSRLFLRLPSLEELDRALHRLLGLGTAVFLLAMAMGILWVMLDRELLGPRWWMSPKVLLAWAAEVFFVALYALRSYSGLRGPKLAGLVVGGFASILVLYIVLSAAQLRTYQFWGGQV